MLAKMLPRAVGPRCPYSIWLNSEALSNDLSRLGTGPNNSDEIRREKALGVRVPMRKPTLDGTVTHIVQLRSREQVRRIATGRIVAMMQDSQAGWNWTMRQFPCDSMRPSDIIRAGKTKISVSTLINTGQPRPAFIWAASVHFAPEPFRDSLSRSHLAPPLPVVRSRARVAPLPAPLSIAEGQ